MRYIVKDITERTIQEIQERFEENFKHTGERYAVLKPQDKYDGVDWDKVSEVIGTKDIHGYSQTDKIVIKL